MPAVLDEISAVERAVPQTSETGSCFTLAAPESFVALQTERCQKIDVSGPEDVAVDHEKGLAYISSQARTRPLSDVASLPGAIYAFDLKTENAAPINVTEPLLAQLGSFHPLGIDLFIGDDQRARLLVVNRANEGCRIEVFAVVDRSTGALEHVCSVGPDELLTNPNEVAASGWDQFYVTNPRRIANVGVLLDDMLHLRSGMVLHCRFSDTGDTTWVVAEEGLSYPNGIAIEWRSDQPRVYVALLLAKKILVYTRTDQGRLARCDAIELPAAPDNLSLDRQGDLWVGASPDLIKGLIYILGRRETSPSVILRVSQPRSDKPLVETIFSDGGQLISASSVACHYAVGGRHKLVIGAPIQDRLLALDLT